MTVIGLKVGYANYVTESEILARSGLSFSHYESADDVVDKAEVNALMVRQIAVDAAMMAQFPKLKVIQRYGVGVDNVDIAEATKRGIKVCNTPDYGQAHEVSDHAVALYLGLARRILTRDRDVRYGSWGVDQAEPIVGHRGATLGLIGFGRIAKTTWTKFRALGFSKCLVSDPALSSNEAERQGVKIATIREICQDSDAISLHCPLTLETRHIIDEHMLRLMKDTAYLINVSRGGLIDEIALTEALESGRIAGAGLDVFEQEPPDTMGPIFMAPNTIITDHIAWYSEASVSALQCVAAEEVVRVLKNGTPRHPVN